MQKRQKHEGQAYNDHEPGQSEISSGLDASAGAPNIKREFLLTQSTDDTLQDAVRLFSRATGTNLTRSHFLRALLKTVSHAMPELEREVLQIGRLKRPSNARQGQEAREQYEAKLAAAVVAALRSTPPFEVATGERRKGRGTGKRST